LRYQKAELDMIAQKDGSLVFVEVKPEEAIDKNKLAICKDAAEGYLEQYPSQAEIRFDVIRIVIAKDET
jgi:putative endonuclease